MKRRNPDNSKFRKLKKNRMGEGVWNGSLIYLKLFMAWALLMMADFVLGFRFEYLWPFWLLIRSIYDSFRYQGVAFSVFFVCITVTSDLVCFLFIPVQWLFFLASTYVWVQYVWHADRGVCLPTVSLWLLFIYVEASVRLKELSASRAAFPFTLDLCRPFAAHCIGYPVVTLGFGVKSYVGYKFRLRKQREVARENRLYAQILAEALPSEWTGHSKDPSFQRYLMGSAGSEEGISNGSYPPSLPPTSQPPSHLSSSQPGHHHKSSVSSSHPSSSQKQPSYSGAGVGGRSWDGCLGSWTDANGMGEYSTASSGKRRRGDESYEGSTSSWLWRLKNRLFGGEASAPGTGDNSDEDEDEEDRESSMGSVEGVSTGGPRGRGGPRKHSNFETANGNDRRKKKRRGTPADSNPYSAATTQQQPAYTKDSSSTNNTSSTSNSPPYNMNLQNGGDSQQLFLQQQERQQKEKLQEKELTLSLEYELEKVRAEVRGSRMVEQDLRNQIQSLANSDKSHKHDLQQARHKSEQLDNKLQNLLRAREQDKQTIQTLEKKLVEEQRVRGNMEQQLEKERKQKKSEEAAVARALAASSKNDNCTESCRTKRRDLEMEVRQTKRELRSREDQVSQLEMEVAQLRQYQESQGNTEVLMSALETMQEKNKHLQQSLSAENRLKQDLFSALGEANRKLEMAQNELMKKRRELQDLRSNGEGSGPASSTVTPPLDSHLPFGSSDTVEAQNLDLLAMYTAAAPYMTNGMGNGLLGGLENGGLGSEYNQESGLLHSSFTPPHSSS